MLRSPWLRQITLFLVLGVGLQAPARDVAPGEDLQRGGNQQDRREDRPRRGVKPERRDAHQERQEIREVKQERREDRQKNRVPREPRHVPPVNARPEPMPRPQPHGQPGDTRPTRPGRRSMDHSEPGSTVLSHDHRYAPSPRSREQARAWEHSHGWRNEGAWGAHSTWREHRARAWESEHRTWAHRGGYGGYIIPEPQFRLHFGPERWFRIRTRPVIYTGYPRFRYGNYWFLIVDPWPEFWSETWYADDDVYVDYNDGYYLYNRRHPGVSIAISVSL